MDMVQPTNQKGFTLVETLVAILLLVFAITGPLTVSNKGLQASIFAENQMTASFLAQDAMEYVKNIKNANVLSGGNWLSNIESCVPSAPCGVSSMNSPQTGISSCSQDLSNCYVYFNTVSGYEQTDSSVSKTIFTRGFYIEQTPNPGERKVTVIVSWQDGNTPYEITLVSYMFDTVIQ